MGQNMAAWKLHEDMMIELRKKNVTIPLNIMDDLRAAKLMIQLSDMEGIRGESMQKVEEYLGNVEAYLITEGQKVLGMEKVDEWLRRLEEVSCEICAEPSVKKPEENKFVVGVPRDQKWVRVEPISTITAEKIEQLAKEQTLSVTKQNDGRLMVYGNPENLKEFLKKMTAQANKK